MTFKEAVRIYNRDYEWWQRTRDVWPTEDFLRRYHPGMAEADYPISEKLLMKTAPALNDLLNDNALYTYLEEKLGNRKIFVTMAFSGVPEDLKRSVREKLTGYSCTKLDMQQSAHVLFSNFLI